jgi:hypothetical protein
MSLEVVDVWYVSQHESVEEIVKQVTILAKIVAECLTMCPHSLYRIVRLIANLNCCIAYTVTILTVFPLLHLKTSTMSSPGKLTNEQKTALNDFTDAYKEASPKEQKGIIKEALEALFPAVPDNDRHGTKCRKELVDKMRKVASEYDSVSVS